MPDETALTRQWREIVADLRKETDPERCSELVRELDESLIEEDQKSSKPRYVITRIVMKNRRPTKQ